MKIVSALRLTTALIILAGSAPGQSLDAESARADSYRRTRQTGLDAYQLGKCEEAAIAFKRAAELAPSESDAFNSLGVALMCLNRQRDAMIALRKAIQRNPRNAEARYNMARQYRISNRLPEAAKEFVAALHIKPNYEAAWSGLGDALLEMSAKAIARIEPEITLKPGIPLADFTLGYVTYRTGRLEQSIAHLTEAISRDPTFAASRNLLGLVYFAQNRDKDAIIEFERAIEVDPNYETARYNLALVCLAAGRRPEAFRQYQTLESLHSNLAAPLLKLVSGDRIVNVRDLLIK